METLWENPARKLVHVLADPVSFRFWDLGSLFLTGILWGTPLAPGGRGPLQPRAGGGAPNPPHTRTLPGFRRRVSLSAASRSAPLGRGGVVTTEPADDPRPQP